MMQSHSAYLESCKQVVETILTPKNSLVEYIRNKKGHACGVVVAYRDPVLNQPLIGWSLCDIKGSKDKKRKTVRFNKYIGLAKAIGEDRVYDLEYAEHLMTNDVKQVPYSVVKTYNHMLARAKAYFKDVE